MSSIIWSDFRYKGLEIKDYIGIPTAGTLKRVRWSVIRQCPTNSNLSTAHNPQFHTLPAHLHHGQLEVGQKKSAQIPQRCLKCPQAFLGYNVPSYLLGVIKSTCFQILRELLVWNSNTAREVWHNTALMYSYNIKILLHNYNTFTSMS